MDELTHVRVLQQGSSSTIRVSGENRWYVIEECWQNGKLLLNSAIVSSWDTKKEAQKHKNDK